MYKLCFRFGLVPVLLNMAEALHIHRYNHSGFENVFFFVPRKGKDKDKLKVVLAGPGEAVCLNAEDSTHANGNGWEPMERSLASAREFSPFIAAVPLEEIRKGWEKTSKRLKTADMVHVTVNLKELEGMNETVSWELDLAFRKAGSLVPGAEYEAKGIEMPPGVSWIRPEAKRVAELHELDAAEAAWRQLPSGFSDLVQEAAGCIHRADVPPRDIPNPLRYAMYGLRTWNGRWAVGGTDGKEIIFLSAEPPVPAEGTDPAAAEALCCIPFLFRPSLALRWSLIRTDSGAFVSPDDAPLVPGERLWRCCRSSGRSFWYMQTGVPGANVWPTPSQDSIPSVLGAATQGTVRWRMQLSAAEAEKALATLRSWKEDDNIYTVLFTRELNRLTAVPVYEGSGDNDCRVTSVAKVLRVRLTEYTQSGDELMFQCIDHMIRALGLARLAGGIVLQCFHGTAGELNPPPLIAHTPVDRLKVSCTDAPTVYLCMERRGDVNGKTPEELFAERVQEADALLPETTEETVKAVQEAVKDSEAEPDDDDFLAEL